MSNITTIISFAIAAAFFILLAMYHQKRKDKSGDWIVVFTTGQSSEAEIVKGGLENEGINAVIMNKRDSSYPSFGPIEILVAPHDVDSAKSIISKFNLEVTE